MHAVASDYARRVGVMISAAMALRDMSQADLSRHSGITASTISRYESGDTEQSAHVMVRLAEALRVPVGLLLEHPSAARSEALVRLGAWDATTRDEL